MANLLENDSSAEKKIVQGGGGGRVDNLDSSRDFTMKDLRNALNANQDSGVVVNMFGDVSINMNEDSQCEKPGGGGGKPYKPESGNGIGFGVKPESGSGVAPESGAPVKPESGSGIKPIKNEALTPAQILDTPPLARGK